MTTQHSLPPHQHIRTGAGGFPFFEFMLYGAKSFAPAASGAAMATVTRGRTLTLVPAPSAGRPRRGGRDT
jgi:hypothetical protein